MGSGGVGEGQWSRNRTIVVLAVEATQHLMRTMFPACAFSPPFVPETVLNGEWRRKWP